MSNYQDPIIPPRDVCNTVEGIKAKMRAAETEKALEAICDAERGAVIAVGKVPGGAALARQLIDLKNYLIQGYRNAGG